MSHWGAKLPICTSFKFHCVTCLRTQRQPTRDPILEIFKLNTKYIQWKWWGLDDLRWVFQKNQAIQWVYIVVGFLASGLFDPQPCHFSSSLQPIHPEMWHVTCDMARLIDGPPPWFETYKFNNPFQYLIQIKYALYIVQYPWTVHNPVDETCELTIALATWYSKLFRGSVRKSNSGLCVQQLRKPAFYNSW